MSKIFSLDSSDFLLVILKKSRKCLANLTWMISSSGRFALVSAVFALL